MRRRSRRPKEGPHCEAFSLRKTSGPQGAVLRPPNATAAAQFRRVLKMPHDADAGVTRYAFTFHETLSRFDRKRNYIGNGRLGVA